MKLIFIITVLISMNVAHAQSSGKGYISLTQEDFYNVPMPNWMIQDNDLNQKNNSAILMVNKNIVDVDTLFAKFDWLLRQHYCTS